MGRDTVQGIFCLMRLAAAVPLILHISLTGATYQWDYRSGSCENAFLSQGQDCSNVAHCAACQSAPPCARPGRLLNNTQTGRELYFPYACGESNTTIVYATLYPELVLDMNDFYS